MIDLTKDERELLLAILNGSNLPGKIAEQIVELKRKLSAEEPTT